MLTAITREVSPRIGDGERTHVARETIDPALAAEQHAGYERCLSDLGCRVRRLGADHDLPDSVFVEDTAVVFDELAILARPGAPSRRAETEAVAEALAEYRSLAAIEPPATLDGGDVLAVGRTVYVGLSSRTDRAGTLQLKARLAAFRYDVRPVEVRGCLHLKSAATQVADETLLIHPGWVAPDAFDGLDLVEIDRREPFAANALRIGQTVVCAAAFPRTRERLEARGIPTVAVDVSELAKAEGGLTCCSVVFKDGGER
ncbi:MAG: dimethylarginine dimethylaminohydrolase family protein [Gemmatimonadota bacterium]